MQTNKLSVIKKYTLLASIGCSLSYLSLFEYAIAADGAAPLVSAEATASSEPTDSTSTATTTTPTPAPAPQAIKPPPLYFGMDIQKIITESRAENPNINPADIIKKIVNNIVVDQNIECVTKVERNEEVNGIKNIKTSYYRISKQKDKNGLVTNAADEGNIATFYVNAAQAFKEAKTERPAITSHQIVLASSPTSVQNYQFNVSSLDQTGDYLCYSRFAQPPISNPTKKVVAPPNVEDEHIPHSRLIEVMVEKYIRANPPVIPDAATAAPNEKVPSRQEVMTQYQKALLSNSQFSQSVVCVTKITDSLYFALSTDRNFQDGFIKDPTGGKLEDDKTTSNIPHKDYPDFVAFFNKIATGKIEEIKYGGIKDKDGIRDSKYYNLIPYPIDANNVCFARVAFDYKPSDS